MLYKCYRILTLCTRGAMQNIWKIVKSYIVYVCTISLQMYGLNNFVQLRIFSHFLLAFLWSPYIDKRQLNLFLVVHKRHYSKLLPTSYSTEQPFVSYEQSSYQVCRATQTSLISFSRASKQSARLSWTVCITRLPNGTKGTVVEAGESPREIFRSRCNFCCESSARSSLETRKRRAEESRNVQFPLHDRYQRPLKRSTSGFDTSRARSPSVGRK